MTIQADVAVVGVGLGGFAAIRALLEQGLKVVAVEEYAWIGGQVSSQSLCVLDEYHDPIAEGIGYSRRYSDFRESLRSYYKDRYRLSSTGASQLSFNPGNSMNSMLVAEPHVAHRVLRDNLEKYVESGALILCVGWMAESVKRSSSRIISVICRKAGEVSADRLELVADFFLDGTEAGDLFPLIPVPFRLGSDGPVFGEAHAETAPNPRAIQSSTVCFAVEYVPGGDFRTPKPEDYDAWVTSNGPFMLDAPGATQKAPSLMFRRQEGESGNMIPPAFYYRSILDVRNFDDPAVPFSRAIINTACNDFSGEPMVGGPDLAAVYEKAKALSKAYFYWLQNEAPRDDCGQGYPEFRLVPEATGTADGFAMAPYIREGRRISGCRTIVEEDIAVHARPGARARHFDDSVGLGCFVIDLHRRTGGLSFSGGVATRPYQIPLASLVSPELENFAVAGKCISTTQITNGAYRLHNIEWAIGEAAGELAAFCLRRKITEPALAGQLLFDYQRTLVRAGVPLFWYEDIGFDHPAFEAIQILSVKGLWAANDGHLRFDGHHSVARSRESVKAIFDRLRSLGVDPDPLEEITLVAHGTRKADVLHRIMKLLDERGWPRDMDNFLIQNRAAGAESSDKIPGPFA